jgi:hypothetical protein
MKNQHVIIADHPAKGEVNHCSIHAVSTAEDSLAPGYC